MTEKETGNAQPGACVDVLPRCSRVRVCHQARELILTNFLTVFSLVYPEEGSIAETSVKILIITASVLQFLN